MSSSDPSSYAGDPNPKPFDSQFKSLKLEQGSDSNIIQKDGDVAQEEGEQESLNENSNNQDDRIDSGDVNSVVWTRTNSEVEVEGPSSPSSSGYAGERGSSGASDDDEIHEVANNDGIDGVFDSQAAWLPGKRHVNEFHGFNC
ncbi:hypothetical protein OIU79_021689 [Salix purpurea]|uniref:Uncharacterized protein n=1 Tax=Salix purpurea TaxID=77065 RepID=A0A9Q0WE14_SALPP|nr:hypothetical protein OIU79_021689 [Salix purpurea]